MGWSGSAGSGRGRRGPREPGGGFLDPAGRLRQRGLLQVTRPQGPWEPVMLELGKARGCKHEVCQKVQGGEIQQAVWLGAL